MDLFRHDYFIPILAAIAAGGIIGFEREYRGRSAGIRTHILVCLTSTILMLAAVYQADWMLGTPHDIIRIDPVRMAHGVLTGIGFLCGGVIFRYARELNAFAIGEDNARHIGVNVRRVKLVILITVSVMIGVCVSIGGSIGFVGLVVPQMARMIAGPNHRRLLPASMFSGAIFLLLADLIARTLLSPVELSIGVVTSLVGAAAFVVIFYRARKAG